MLRNFASLALLLVVLGAVQHNAHASPRQAKLTNFNPLCPKALQTDKARAECYAATLKTIYQTVASADPRNNLASAPLIEPYLAPDVLTRSPWAEISGSTVTSQYLSSFTAVQALSSLAVGPFKFTGFATTGNVADIEAVSLFTDITSGAQHNWSNRGLFQFNSYNKIQNMDFDFGRDVDMRLAFGVLPPEDATLPTFNVGPASFACNMTQTFCTGANQQWDNVTECVEYMVKLPFYPLDAELHSNSVACRAFTAFLLAGSPSYWCPYMSRSGGGGCTDLPYSRFSTYFPQGVFIGLDPYYLQ